jgi:hypothetical protein
MARRFHAAVLDAIDAMLAMPEAGPPKHTGNPRLTGLRSWHVKGFDEFRVYPGASGADNRRPHPARQAGHRHHSGRQEVEQR